MAKAFRLSQPGDDATKAVIVKPEDIPGMNELAFEHTQTLTGYLAWKSGIGSKVMANMV